MAKSLTIKQFLETYPDDDACLAHLFETRYGKEPVCPKCGQIGTFHKLKKLPAYTCNCGHHIHPMAGTPFERSRTSLQDVVLCHVSVLRHPQRRERQGNPAQIGVTYKTAWRIGHEIRKYMGWVDGDRTLGRQGRSRLSRSTRPSSAVMTRHGPGRQARCARHDRARRRGADARKSRAAASKHVVPVIQRWVKPGSRIHTDTGKALWGLDIHGYQHERVDHSKKE